MTFTIRELDASTWDDFAELVERNNGIFGGCWCTSLVDARRSRRQPRVLAAWPDGAAPPGARDGSGD